MVALCLWEMQLQCARSLIMVQGGAGLQMVALCYWEMQLQIARRLVMVGSLDCWGCWVVQIARGYRFQEQSEDKAKKSIEK